MTLAIADLSFADLRDRLKARAERGKSADDLNPNEVLRYLASLPISEHTATSADGLLHLSTVFGFGGQQEDALESARLAVRIAIASNDRLLLSRARNSEGVYLVRLGRLTDAAIARDRAWSLARELGDKRQELGAVWGFSSISVAMGQWHAAIFFCERMRELAEELGNSRLEFIARNNLADCALQLRDPTRAMHALSKLATDAAHTDIDAGTHTHLNINLGRSWLLLGDVGTASLFANKAAETAAAWGMQSLLQRVNALQGLVDVRLGSIEKGFAAMKNALDFAKRSDNAEVPDCLSMCIDAYESAGRLEEALAYLQELVEWKKRLVDAEVTGSQFQGPMGSVRLQTGTSLFDDGLVAKVHSLKAGVQSRVERLLEIALNAGIASGDDLYRPFRIANLARHLATSIGWDERRIDPLVLGAQLFKIGMIAIPVRLLVKPGRLSEGESNVLRSNSDYGAQVLRKSTLQILETAAVVAEQRYEHYDGSGFPHGLSGEAIAKESRIVAICDAFDEMTHKRPSRLEPLSFDVALEMLTRNAGRQFDPRLVEEFVDFIQLELPKQPDFDAFLQEGADQVEYVRARARMEALINGRDEVRGSSS